jgi:hypothetical protein
VAVSGETKRLLDGLRARLGARTYDEAIRRLVEAYRELEQLRAQLLARRLLCNDLSEARATMQAWVRLLTSRADDPALAAAALPIAVEYLVPDPQEPGVYVVSRERCASSP